MTTKKKDIKFENIENAELQRRCFRRFIGCLIRRGNRLVAERMFREIITRLFESGEHPLVLILTALRNIKPSFSLFSKRVGGTVYKLPVFLTEEQSYTVAIHWLIKNALKRSEPTATERILNEILLTLRGNSVLVKRRDEIHNIALKNRPFLKYKRR